MLVTLNCDGSIDWGAKKGRKKKAGWAYWIASDVGRFKDFGRCPDCTNSMGPELVAIAKGIHFIRNHSELRKATKIIVNTDCMPGINWMTKPWKERSHEQRRKHRSTLHNIARHHIIQMISEGYGGLPKVDVEYRHVMAHTNDLSEARKWVNDWLDKKAKEGRFMKLKRKRKK